MFLSGQLRRPVWFCPIGIDKYFTTCTPATSNWLSLWCKCQADQTKKVKTEERGIDNMEAMCDLKECGVQASITILEQDLPEVSQNLGSLALSPGLDLSFGSISYCPHGLELVIQPCCACFLIWKMETDSPFPEMVWGSNIELAKYCLILVYQNMKAFQILYLGHGLLLRRNLSRVWAFMLVLLLNKVVLRLFLILTHALAPHQVSQGFVFITV